MREQLRSLEQDIQNVQNGSSMLRTAHGGIENIVEELRSLKELAINAANDSNTDKDREIIQKEFDQRRATIDEIAQWTTYNTKPLLDGSYAITRPINTIGDSMNKYSEGFSVGSPNCSKTNSRYTGYGLTADVAFSGNGNTWDDTPFVDGLQWSNGTDLSIYEDIAVKMDFSKVPMNSSLHNGGFSILCGGCSQFVNIQFDSTINSSQSSRSRMPDGSDQPINYKIGIAGVSDMGQLAEAIFDGVKAIDGSRYRINSNGAEILMLDLNHNVNLMKRNGTYYITKNASPQLCVYNSLIKESGDGDDIQRPLTIHHGTKANQRTNFYINDMHCKSLGINAADVTTRENATSSISIIDNAIEYALGEATYMGAYLQQLEYMESNVTTQEENTQAAESTMRDADMAKEMTEYTKQNVLSQAAQSMLAQANQNLSSVLSLLQ